MDGAGRAVGKVFGVETGSSLGVLVVPQADRVLGHFVSLSLRLGAASRVRRSWRNYFIFSYAAAKSASGSGTVSVSLLRFWNDTFNCLPAFIAASRSAAIAVPA